MASKASRKGMKAFVLIETAPGKTKAVKKALSRNRLTHPLFDTNTFCRDIEKAYTAMWARWRRGWRPPAGRPG